MTATNHDDQRHNLVKFVQGCHELNLAISYKYTVSFSRFHCCGRHDIPCGHRGLWTSWYRPLVSGWIIDTFNTVLNVYQALL